MLIIKKTNTRLVQESIQKKSLINKMTSNTGQGVTSNSLSTKFRMKEKTALRLGYTS